MVSINAIYTMDSVFTVHYPPFRKKVPRVCGQMVNALNKVISMPEKERSKQRKGREFL